MQGAPRLDRLLNRYRLSAGPAFFLEDGGALQAAAFDGLVARTAAWIGRQGLVPGDCLAVWLPNRIEWLALLFAAARKGVRIASVNTRYRGQELEHILAASGAHLLVLQPTAGPTDFAAILRTVDLSRLPDLRRAVFLVCEAPPSLPGLETAVFALGTASPTLPDRRSDPEAPLIHFATSGTTSAPKLVTHPQRTLTLHAERSAAAFGFAEPDAAFLAAMPLCGIFGLSAALAAIAGGGAFQLLSHFAAEPAARLIAERGITHLIGSDEMFRRLLDVEESLLDGTRLCGFAAFTPGVLPRLKAAAERRVPFRGLYGSSEINAIFAIQPADLPLDERLKGGGRLASGSLAAVRVRDRESGRLLPDGAEGELEFRADTNFIGYHANPEATAKAVDSEGFFRSGDLGYRRPDGSFVYLTRLGDAIRLGGFLVDPAEIEAVLRALPGLGDAQVVALPLEGQLRPVAFVIPAPGSAFDEAAAIAAAKERLASFKVPRRVFPLEAFPTTESANGVKIQKAKLRQMAEKLLA